MATKKSAHSNHSKKELKKELAQKIETALPEIEESLGKKKFNKRLKKVTRLLVKGVHFGTDKKSKTDNKKEQHKKKAIVSKKATDEKITLNQKDANTSTPKQHT
jgi:hypothetical protein